MVTPDQVKWSVGNDAFRELATIRKKYGDAWYEAQVVSMRKFLCFYFSAEGGCAVKGMNISPLGGTPDGGKRLKVRWRLPGMGKSGGLRLLIVAHCQTKHVAVADAELRKNDPDFDD